MLLAIGLLGAAVPAQAQEARLAEADAALRTCAEAVRTGDEDAAETAADRARALYEAAERRGERVADALAGQARVIGQCLIPTANFLRIPGLSGRSIELSQRALAVDSMHLGARVNLALNYYHTPGFMGKADDALRELQWLVRHYGDRADLPVMGDVYFYLGSMQERQGREAEALATWRRGLELFPEHAALRKAEAEVEGEGATGSEPRAALVRETGAEAPVSDTGAPQPPRAETPATPSATSTSTSASHYTLAPLVVEAGSYAVEDARAATPLTRLDVVTTPGGTADILQVFQLMPGVTRATEGSELYVRGGDPAEAPVYVDGARLIYPGTFETLHGGLFGVVDPAVLERAYFSSGGFSARWGNALSGVLDLSTEGRPAGDRASVGANLVGASGAVRASFTPSLGGWAAGRLTRTEALLWLHDRGEEYPEAPRSWQGIASVAFEPRAGRELKLVALAQEDDARVEVDAMGWSGDLRAAGETRLVALTGRLLSADAATALRATLGLNQRVSAFRFGVLDRRREDRAATLRLDAERELGAGSVLRGGVEAAALAASEDGTVPTSPLLAPGSPAERLAAAVDKDAYAGAYVEAELRPTAALAVVAGVRADRLPGLDAAAIDPRLALAYRMGPWTWRLSGGVFHQGTWRVGYDVPDSGSPTDLPTRATHIAGGVQREGGAVSLRLEGWLKDYDEYRAHGDGPRVAAGRAAGLDALLRLRGTGALTGWLAYSLLDGELELADGRRVASAVDVTHTATAVGRLAVRDLWELGLTGRYATGRPHTPVTGPTPTSPGAEPDAPAQPAYGAPHADRLPAYVRLDGRVTRLQPLGGRLLVFYLEALNLLDRQNVQAYTYADGYRSRRAVESFFAHRTLVLGVEAQL